MSITAFMQDSWKALFPNLTINAGRALGEADHHEASDDVTYINIDHFSPRVGFSWDFSRTARRSFRLLRALRAEHPDGHEHPLA